MGVMSQLKVRLGEERYRLLQAVSLGYQRNECGALEYYDVALDVLQGDSMALLLLVERLPDEAKRSEVRAVHATRSQAEAAATVLEVERLRLHDDAALAAAQDHAQSLQWGRAWQTLLQVATS